MMNHEITRRTFLQTCAAGVAAAGLPGIVHAAPGSDMRFGLVTYLWGQHWDLPALIQSCEASGVLGVELRTTHAHGVEPSLSKSERAEVKKRFADSAIEWVGIGSNERYDSPDASMLEQSIRATEDFVRLSHDIGGTGVKVKPDRFHDGVPHEQTIEQIGRSLNHLGAFGADFGQEIRLEVHGQCGELPTIAAIMDVADHPNVAVCWNSNDEDLQGDGLEHNFNLVRSRFGDTVHVREVNIGDYPYAKLVKLLVDTDYTGWVLLEARTDPEDKVAALIEQREAFERMIADAQG